MQLCINIWQDLDQILNGRLPKEVDRLREAENAIHRLIPERLERVQLIGDLENKVSFTLRFGVSY